jgi:hypothetical protein
VTKRKASEDLLSARRPSLYKPEYARVAKSMCLLGATDVDLAEAFDVNTSTIWRWQARYPEFCNALRVGKAEADDRVERSLYQRAVGYTYDSEKLFCYEGEVTRAEIVEHVPPDVGAAKLWLHNRRPDKWREKVDVEQTGAINVTIRRFVLGADGTDPAR